MFAKVNVERLPVIQEVIHNELMKSMRVQELGTSTLTKGYSATLTKTSSRIFVEPASNFGSIQKLNTVRDVLSTILNAKTTRETVCTHLASI